MKTKTKKQQVGSSLEFRRVAEQIRRLRESSQAMRDLLRERGPGRYEEATVYAVRSHQVRSYWREGWIGVRAKKLNTK